MSASSSGSEGAIVCVIGVRIAAVCAAGKPGLAAPSSTHAPPVSHGTGAGARGRYRGKMLKSIVPLAASLMTLASTLYMYWTVA
jgi:hypothetical protein